MKVCPRSWGSSGSKTLADEWRREIGHGLARCASRLAPKPAFQGAKLCMSSNKWHPRRRAVPTRLNVGLSHRGMDSI